MQTFNKITLQRNGEYKSSDNANGTFSNDRYTLICVESGFLTIKTNARKLLLCNKCIIVKNGVDFTINNVGKKTSSFITISIDKNFIDGFIKNYPEFKTALNVDLALVFTPDKRLYNLLFDKINSSDTPAFIGLSTAIIADGVSAFYGFKNLNKLQSATLLKERIDNYSFLTEKIYDEYKKYPVSHTALISEFKVLTGLTPNDYYVNKTIDLSKTLLAETTLLVNEISEVTGYKSISHFIKQFKERSGVTPLSYKNSIN